MADPFPYCKYACYTISSGIPSVSKMPWIGQHLSKIVVSTHMYHSPPESGEKPSDFTLAFAENPDLEVYPYISTSNYRFSYVGSSYSGLGLQWRDYKLWLESNPSYTQENAFWHYRYDHTSLKSNQIGQVLVPGYPVSISPGYGSGSATLLNHSWVPSQQFGSMATPSFSINTVSRSSNLVTVTTSTAHSFTLNERVTIAGVSDASFNGSFDLYSIPSTYSFIYSQSLPDASSSGGTVSQSYYNCYYINVINNEWKQFFIDCFTDARGSSYEWMKDVGGNVLKGPYMDSILNMVIKEGTEGTDKALISWNTVAEYLDNGGYYTDGREAKRTAMCDFIGTWWAGIRTGIQSYATPLGKTVKTACNGDGPKYVHYNKAAFYEKDYVDVILIEGGNTPDTSSATTYINYYKSAYDLMATYNKEVIFEGESYSYYPYDQYHGATIVWYNYSGDIWYTDNFTGQKSQVTYLRRGGITAKYVSASTPVGLPSGQLYTDTSISRVYANYGSGYNPNTLTGNYLTQGLDPGRFRVFGTYLLFHHSRASYAHQEFPTDEYTYNVDPGTEYTWFEALEWAGDNLGDPDTGGTKIDGSIATDLWGVSCSTSNKAYAYYTDSADASRNVYGRKFDNGYIFLRFSKSIANNADRPGTDFQTYSAPTLVKQVYSDGSYGNAKLSFDLARGEGVLLTTLDLEPPPDPTGQKYLIGIFV